MAIPLTPRQQKAQFGAFDTTSQFTSGLEGVGRAIGDVASSVQRHATSVKQKRKKAQDLLAREADVARTQALAEAKGQYKTALDSGNREAIDSAYSNIETVINTPLPRYVSESLGGTLDDAESISRYDAGFKKTTADYLVSLDLEKNQRIIVNNADNQLTQYNQKLATALNDSGGLGLNTDTLTQLLSDPFITNEEAGYREIASSLTQEGSDTFRSSIRNSILGIATADLEDTLDPNKLQQKREKYSQFIKENPDLEFQVSDIDKLDDQFKKSMEAGGDPKALEDMAEKNIADAIPALETFVAESTKNPQEALRNYVDAASLLEDSKEYLKDDNATLERLEATVGLLKIFAPKTFIDENGIAKISSEPSDSHAMLQEFMDSATPEAFTSTDVLSNHVSVRENRLDSSAISKLKDWLSVQRTGMMNEIKKGDPSFIRRLSPTYDMLYTKAQTGDKGARAVLEKEYNRYVKGTKKGFGFTLPKVLHIPLQDPMPDTLDKDTVMVRMQNEIDLNSLLSTSQYSGAQLNNGLSSVDEQAYYQLMWANSNIQLTGGNPVNVEKAAGYLDASERAEKEHTDLLAKILSENETFLSVAIDNTKLTADKNFSGALSKYLLGIIVSSDATEYEDVVDQVKALEKEVLIPLFGYTTETDSSASIVVPSSIVSKYGDFDQIPYFKGMFARLGASYNNKIDPRTVSDIYANSVYGLIAKKYKINTAANLQKIIDLGLSEDPVGSVGFTIADVESMMSPVDSSLRAYKALARGMKENTRTVGVEERPVGRISLPVVERNAQGKLEQRIYLETTSGDRDVKKTTTEEGDLMYITVGEVDRLMGKVISRYVNPLDVLLGKEELFNAGLTDKSSRLNTVMDEIRQESEQDVLTAQPLE